MKFSVLWIQKENRGDRNMGRRKKFIINTEWGLHRAILMKTKWKDISKKKPTKKKNKGEEKAEKVRGMQRSDVWESEIILPNYIHTNDVRQRLPCCCTSKRKICGGAEGHMDDSKKEKQLCNKSSTDLTRSSSDCRVCECSLQTALMAAWAASLRRQVRSDFT